MTEAELFEEVRKLLHLYGWLYYHTHDSRRSNPGFPDLVMVRPSSAGGAWQLLYRELKSEKGRLTDEQDRWLWALREAYCDMDVWRPSDMERIEKELR